jgi:hypothetical protein
MPAGLFHIRTSTVRGVADEHQVDSLIRLQPTLTFATPKAPLT